MLRRTTIISQFFKFKSSVLSQKLFSWKWEVFLFENLSAGQECLAKDFGCV